MHHGRCRARPRRCVRRKTRSPGDWPLSPALFQLFLHAAYFILALPASNGCRHTQCRAPATGSRLPALIQILLHQLLCSFHRHQRAAEADVVGHRPELQQLRDAVVVAHAANAQGFTAGSVADRRRVITVVAQADIVGARQFVTRFLRRQRPQVFDMTICALP